MIISPWCISFLTLKEKWVTSKAGGANRRSPRAPVWSLQTALLMCRTHWEARWWLQKTGNRLLISLSCCVGRVNVAVTEPHSDRWWWPTWNHSWPTRWVCVFSLNVEPFYILLWDCNSVLLLDFFKEPMVCFLLINYLKYWFLLLICRLATFCFSVLGHQWF